MNRNHYYVVSRRNACLALILLGSLFGATVRSQTIQFVYTSDAHYGITRAKFQGAATVDAHTVNAAMIAKINSLPALSLPSDGGVNAGTVVGGIDYVFMTGDIANRQESPIQSAAASWAQFKTDYIDGLTVKNSANQKAGLLLAPGNHDVSNAIGYYKTMAPLTDSTVMVNIYSLMMPTPRPAGNYNYANERIHYSKDISGVHFMFVNMWPDSAERIWMASDLQKVGAATPVIVFTHDQPLVESKHFTNPNGAQTINSTDKFENLLPESFKDGSKKITDPSTIEQKAFAAFLKANPNIVAYFHGNDNENKFYIYNGPDSSVALNVFQVDSPMKGNFSGTVESKLSFQLVSIDTKVMKMTVRECLWDSTASIVFGAMKSVALAPVSTIKAARSAGAGASVNFEGVVTRLKGNYTYVQDTTAGIVLYVSSGAYKDSVVSGGIKAGDRIRIQGKISVYNSLYEIVAADLVSFQVISRGNAMPAPVTLTLKDISTNGSQYQARLVKVYNITVAGTDAIFAPAKTYSIADKMDSSNVVALRIGNATDTDADSLVMLKAITFTGPLGQFSSSDPTKGFQLMPILKTDIVDAATTGITTGASSGMPATYELLNNYPNPFNPSTVIRFAVPQQSMAKLGIYDMLGREVRILVDGMVNAGYFEATWNGTNNAGVPVSSGLYMYRIEAGGFSAVKKMVLLK